MLEASMSRSTFPSLRPRLFPPKGVSAGLMLVSGVLTGFTPGFAQDNAPVIRIEGVSGVNATEMFVPDEFVVVLKPEIRGNIKISRSARGGVVTNVDSITQAIARAQVVEMEKQFVSTLDPNLPDFTSGHHLVRIQPGASLDAAMAEFARDPNVDHVEKIGIHPVYVEPNDPYYKDSPNPSFPYDQWHYFDRGAQNHSIQAEQAWDIQTGSPDVVVGILDTGARYWHTDLGGNNAAWGPGNPQTNGNIFVNAGEIPGNGIDDDANGFVDDTIGYDFIGTNVCTGFYTCCDTDCNTIDNDPRDHHGHGTHVSGTVGAITNNNRLVAGVAGGFSDGTTGGAGNGVKIMPLRMGQNCSYFGTCGYGLVRMDSAAQALNYVAMMIDRGVNITAVNCSWGSSNSGGIDAAVNAVQARGVLVVHAAGNSNSSTADYLGSKAGVLNVAATDVNGNGASFTNWGTWVDVAAPGVAIMSTWHEYTDPTPDYIALLDGTSMAAPHIVGIAALLESCNTTLTGTDKFNLIVGNVRPYTDTRNLGSGIANAYLALTAAGCTAGGCSTDPECDDGLFCNGAETCNAGSCQAGTPPNCNDGVACTTDSCNESTDTCDHAPNNGACNDGLFCNGSETCHVTLGCQAGTPPNCNDGVACTDDSCNESTDSCNNVPNNANCDDGLFCNGAESCSATLGCQTGSDPCPGLACNETTDACVCDDNGDCDDGLFCNGTEICSGGSCQSGSAPNCDDGVACTTDSCNEGTDSCDHIANNAACDDGLFCNGAETCHVTLGCQAGTDPCAGNPCDEGTDTCQGAAQVWMVFETATAVPGVGTVENEDIAAYDLDTLTWSLIFDGSDVGLGGLAIDGMSRLSTGGILLSFTAAASIPGLTGGPNGTNIDDSDIILFMPTSLGSTTAGSFSFYFDGSDVGLTVNDEDVDAIGLAPDGRLLISVIGSFAGTGAGGNDEDLFVFTATSLGSATSGSFALYLDGSDVGLNTSNSEDIDAASYTPAGTILLSTIGNFAVTGVSGADEDIFEFFPTTLGTTTSGSFAMFLDLSTLGIATSADVTALEYVEP